MTEEIAPLDAYTTAKDGEPTYTLQGGDPLAAPLLRIWAIFARIQAGVIPEQGTERVYAQILKAANDHQLDTTRDKDELLLRATETERVSWIMDDYLKGIDRGEIVEEKRDFSAFARMDLYDLRRRCSSFISQFNSEFNEYRLELIQREYLAPGDYIDRQFLQIIEKLKYINSTIEIKRGS
jgi:hypothetical protein